MPALPSLLAVLITCSVGISQAGTPAKLTDLFNGRDFTGWEFIANPPAAIVTACKVEPNGVLALAGKPGGWIATTASYENYRLHFEWRWTGKPSNAGVLVHISTGPKDRIWPECFQIQMKTQRAGDVLPMASATCTELPSPTATQINRQKPASEKPPGQWNTCDLVCRGDTIECTINGVLQNKVTNCQPHSGRIGFQLEGAPYELRRIAISPL